MIYQKRVYEVDGKWIYEIYSEGTSPCIRQDCDPILNGFVEMTEDTANQRADDLLLRMDSNADILSTTNTIEQLKNMLRQQTQ